MESLKPFLDNVTHSINHVIETLDYKSLEEAKYLILNQQDKGGRIHVTGVGKPGHVAGYIASLLSSTGTPTYELHATEAVHGSSGQVKTGDVVIAISNSGETEELKATVETLNKNGAYVIATTRSQNSWLAHHSDVCLLAHVDHEGDTLNKPPRASILAEIIVLQCLSILLQESQSLTEKNYLRWHPGGSLGKSIRNKGE